MEQKYPNFRQYFSSQFWAIRPETLDMMCGILSHRVNGISLTQEEIQARIGIAQHQGQAQQGGSIRILPLYGVIDQKVSFMQQISGGTSVEQFMDAFRAALADKSISAIIFDVDSPGGSISGVPEAANEIFQSRGKKPIIAVADPMIASAAYWLSCAADEVWCMPSGWVGSIGVIRLHDDISAMNEMEGYKPTYITYGKFKSEGNHDEPLSDEAKQYYQGQVDTFGDTFTSFVAKARGISVDDVRSNFGQGRMLLAKAAKSAKMIDGIGTMEQTIARLQKPSGALKTMAQATIQAGNTKCCDAAKCECDGDDGGGSAKTCGCACGANCECKGACGACCGDASHSCCAPSAKTTAQDFSTMKVTQASKEVQVGLHATIESWDGLVARQIAGGIQPVLSQGKKDSIIGLRKSLGESATRLDGIIAKFTEPKVSEKPQDDARKKAEADYTKIHNKAYGIPQ